MSNSYTTLHTASRAARAILAGEESATGDECFDIGHAAFTAAKPGQEHRILRGMLAASKVIGDDRMVKAIESALRVYEAHS